MKYDAAWKQVPQPNEIPTYPRTTYWKCVACILSASKITHAESAYLWSISSKAPRWSSQISFHAAAAIKKLLVSKPAHKDTLGKHSVQKPTPQFGNIASIEGRVYNERIGKMYPRCIFSLHIKSLLSHPDRVFEVSGSRHFLARYMDFFAQPP